MNDRAYPSEAPHYLRDGKLQMKSLLEDFQQFWRKNSETWVERYQYKEEAPHLILQAFLQRVVNSGGSISREMATGTGRLDLCVHYGGCDYPVELKLRYGEETYEEGASQLAEFMDKMGCMEGWLLFFDRRVKVPWEKKIFWRSHEVEGKKVLIAGC